MKRKGRSSGKEQHGSESGRKNCSELHIGLAAAAMPKSLNWGSPKERSITLSFTSEHHYMAVVEPLS